MLLKSMILHSSRDDVIMVMFDHCHTVVLWHRKIISETDSRVPL